MKQKDLDKVPLVGGAYITVVGKIEDIIEFAKMATQKEKQENVKAKK